jgi:ABC-type antimicrobial peptide transport system permease subunit
MDDLVTQSLERPRSLSLLVAVFAAVALVLTVIGIYGAMSAYVQQHRKEIGIRMALGGTASAVLRLVVGHGMRMVAAGVLTGILIALAGSRFLSGLLFGVGGTDARTYAGVSLALAAVALAACLVPARRAIGIQPAVTLRND